MEFLIAILTKRLLLREDDGLEIANNVLASEALKHFHLLAEYLTTEDFRMLDFTRFRSHLTASGL